MTAYVEVIRGTPVLLVFYPLAFSGICSGELCQVRDNLNEYLSDDVQVLTNVPGASS